MKLKEEEDYFFEEMDIVVDELEKMLKIKLTALDYIIEDIDFVEPV